MHSFNPESRSNNLGYYDSRYQKKLSVLAFKDSVLAFKDTSAHNGISNQSIEGNIMPSKQVQSEGGKARAAQLSPAERSAIAAKGGEKRADVLSPGKRSEIASQGGKAKAKK